MKNAIINYIKKNQPISYDKIEARVIETGRDLFEFEEAMQQVHKDRRIKVTDKLVYSYKEPEKKSPNPGSDWLRNNYPRIEYEMPFPEIDMSYLFLKPDEMRAYLADAKGMPEYMLKSKYGKRRK